MLKFCVLLSVYNRENSDYLAMALHSIFNQTLLPNQVVIVEDGPLTNDLYRVIMDYVNTYSIITVVKLSSNMGLGNALNEGLKFCKYDIVARMDSDDICCPTRFEEQIRIFELMPDIAIVGSWIEEFASDPDLIESQRRLPETNNELIQFAKTKCPVNHMTVLFRKSAVDKAGGYQHFYLFEDYWLWVRMIKTGAKFYNVQKPLVKVRGGIAMIARRGGLKYAISEIRLQKKMLDLDFISYSIFVRNVSIRFTIRILPNKLRLLIYKNILR